MRRTLLLALAVSACAPPQGSPARSTIRIIPNDSLPQVASAAPTRPATADEEEQAILRDIQRKVTTIYAVSLTGVALGLTALVFAVSAGSGN